MPTEARRSIQIDINGEPGAKLMPRPISIRFEPVKISARELTRFRKPEVFEVPPTESAFRLEMLDQSVRLVGDTVVGFAEHNVALLNRGLMRATESPRGSQYYVTLTNFDELEKRLRAFVAGEIAKATKSGEYGRAKELAGLLEPLGNIATIMPIQRRAFELNEFIERLNGSRIFQAKVFVDFMFGRRVEFLPLLASMMRSPSVSWDRKTYEPLLGDQQVKNLSMISDSLALGVPIPVPR
jgi:hypothetical protein